MNSSTWSANMHRHESLRFEGRTFIHTDHNNDLTIFNTWVSRGKGEVSGKKQFLSVIGVHEELLGELRIFLEQQGVHEGHRFPFCQNLTMRQHWQLQHKIGLWLSNRTPEQRMMFLRSMQASTVVDDGAYWVINLPYWFHSGTSNAANTFESIAFLTNTEQRLYQGIA